MKLEYAQQLFEKSLDISFNENTSSGVRVLCGETDRET